MPKSCAICEKGPAPGNKYKRRGMVRRKGGARSKIVGNTLRTFMPNVQKVKTKVAGTVRTILVCAKCIKAGKVVRV